MNETLDSNIQNHPAITTKRGFLYTEIVLFSAVVLGLLATLSHLSEGMTLLVLSTVSYAIYIFVIGAFYKPWPLKIINLCTGIIMIGTLFTLMSWPGASILNIGVYSIVVIILLFFLLQYQYPYFAKEHKFLISRTVFFIALGITLKFMSHRTFYTTFVDSDPIGAELYTNMKQHPDNENAGVSYRKYKRSKSQNFIITDSTYVP